MPTEVVFKTITREMMRESVAELFEDNVAYHLKRGQGIPMGAEGDALVAGDKYVNPKPASRLTFEITVEREEPTDRPGQRSLEFKLTWDESDDSGVGGSE